MNITQIQDLIKFVAKSGVSEVEIEQKDFKITIKTPGKGKQEFVQVAAAPMMAAPAPMAMPAPVASAAPVAPVAEAPVASNLIEIRSPMIGTFYRSASPYMTPELRERMGEAAIKAALAVGYEGVGTVEFLVDKDRNFYFMEMNTRIQVEHTITEEVIDYDLVKEQIKLAAGEPISGRNYYPTMHAIQCRINAEDPYKNFMPSPGKITDYHCPGGHGVRIDAHAYAGYVIPPFYDSMISKLITVAQTREEAIAKMQRALDEYIIEGVKTTIPFHQKLMKDEKFRSGDFTTKFLEDWTM